MRGPSAVWAVLPKYDSGIVCRSCRLRKGRHLGGSINNTASLVRTASTTAPSKSPPTSGLAPLSSSRRLLSVGGADAARFLQGIITNSITSKDGVARTDPFYAGFLNATGRVLHDVFVYPNPTGYGAAAAAASDDGFLVECDANQIDHLMKYIKRYKLRAKVDLRKLDPEEVGVWHAWGIPEPEQSGHTSDQKKKKTIVFRDPRVPGFGHRLLRAGTAPPELDVEACDESSYRLRRYLHGVAEGQDEIIQEHGLPLESNMDLMNGIDFRKGCYVGQELTIRTKHRGVVRKRILPCMIYEKSKPPPQSLSYRTGVGDDDDEDLDTASADQVPAGTSIGRFDKRGRSAGKWLSGFGNIGLALCRLEIMTDVETPGENGSAGFQQDHEFVLEWGAEDDRTGVKVKAFVPDWMRTGLARGQQQQQP